jgi:hypothetical protein
MAMESLDEIKTRVEAAVPGAKVEIVTNASPSQQSSLLIDMSMRLKSRDFFAMIRHCVSIFAPTSPGSIGSTAS